MEAKAKRLGAIEDILDACVRMHAKPTDKDLLTIFLLRLNLDSWPFSAAIDEDQAIKARVAKVRSAAVTLQNSSKLSPAAVGAMVDQLFNALRELRRAIN